jgi:hypothetical protein
MNNKRKMKKKDLESKQFYLGNLFPSGLFRSFICLHASITLEVSRL